MKNIIFNLKELFGYSNLAVNPDGQPTVNRRSRLMSIICLFAFLTLGVGQMWGNGGIGYKGVKFTKNGSATGWYNIHNVSWDYSNSSYECRSGQSGVTDFNNADLGTVTTLKLKAFVVIGWTDNEDYVAGQLKYRLYKQSGSAPSYSTYNVGNYGTSSNSAKAANVLVSSDNNRVVGSASLTTDIVTASTAPGNYYLQLQGLGRMQWSNGSSHGDFNANNGSEVKATLLVPGFETTSTSHTFGSVNVGSNSSTTKSFTQHYGTTLTTSNCAISGTNSGDFSVTSISETGVTIKFAPTSAGSKSATLTITDANSKTCTITLTGTGTTPPGLTVVAGTGISAVTGSDADISAGDKIAITATVATGYTWDRWTLTGSGTLSTFTATTKNQTVTVGTAGSMTLTASGTERMSALSTSCHYDAGNPSYAAPTVSGSATKVGYVTTRTITAASAGTGYTFAGWTLTNCTRTDGGAPTATSITIRSNGDGAAATVVANYNEVLTSRWHLVGANVASKVTYPDGWNVSNISMMQKATGHSTESVVYADVTVSNASGTYEFKVVDDNGASDDIWYGYSTGGTYLTWTGTSTKNVYSGNGNSNNLKFTPTVAGTYKFKVDYSGTYPAVTITYPVSYTLTYDIGTVKGNNGSISTSPSTSSGSKVLSGTNVTLTGPAAAAGYTWKGWYTNAAGTTGKIDDVSRAITVTMNADKTLYACYTINNHAITHSASTHGSYTIQVGSAVAVSANTTSDYGKTIKLAATPATGYHFGSWSAYKTGTPATTVTVTSNQFTMPDYAVTVGATFTPNTYTVSYNANGGSGTTTSSSHTYDVSKALTTNGYSKTGYNFGGWATSKANADAGTVAYTNGQSVINLVSTQGATVELWAIWNAKQCTINFDFDATDPGHGSHASATTSTTATYAVAMPSVTPPTAANGYAFMGYYDAADGTGTKYYNADGSSANNWAIDTEETTTLYAYYEKAEITAITLNNTIFDPVAAGGTGFVIANPTIAPTPAGTTKICWELLYDNDNPVPAGHEAQAYAEEGKPNQVRFSIAGLAASRYKIKATLRTGSSCDGGTELSTFTQTFTIASSFTVTILYQDDDNNNIAPGTTSPGKATDWTTISAPDIFGYSFVGWTLGEGITTEDPTGQQNDFRFKASYYGTIVAQYTKNQYIYLDLSQSFSTYGKWDNPYVYFYNGDPWVKDKGAGAKDEDKTHTHYISGHAMTKIDGTDIWYFDYGGVSGATRYVAFTWGDKTMQENFNSTDVIFRGDFSESTPLFVPATDGTTESRKTVVNEAQYYNKGYWVTYLGEATGYTLLVYNSAGDVELKREPFIAADKRMTMTSTVQLDASSTYKIEVLRNDGYWYKAASNFTASSLGPKPILPDGTKNAIQTNADGIYTFTLGYISGNLQLSVVYPSSIGDFRIAYTDNATWSHSHTLESWILPSKTITHRANGIDTVSFFISKGAGITPKIRWQKVTAVSESSVTWGTTGEWLTTEYTDVDEAGVYNFKVTQNADGTSIASIERIGAYDGSYYIRCNALRSKWDHYTIDSDHRMTYSEFSESAANSFGEKYSHYKAKWCPRNTNIAFVIANDYSPCLTDKLTTDVGGPDFNNLEADGTLKYEKTGGGGMMYNDANAYLDKYSANVRFMWNRKTNKTSRAYVSAATSTNAKFLVLQGSGMANSNIYNGTTGYAFTANPPGANSVILKDDQNWIYEEVIKANPSALVKLYANYCDQTQWFRGADGTPFTKDVNAIELLGGSSSSSKYAVRVIYDFKTNRLVCAWMPEGASQEIETNLTVNADVMVVREHQGSAQCITFANDKSMTGVKTVYGAMKFNRWILSNRAHPEDTNPDHCRESNIGADLANFHPVLPIGQQLSIYERSLYFISFPFDVKASEIFGFGHYWDEWYLEYYDGETRAKNGYWKDSPANWKYVTPDMLEDFTLKANEGYILGLDLDFMKVDNTTFWSNGISTVELYFPSTVNLGTLQQTDVTIPALSSDYKCTINRGTPEGDRRVKDSYWRCLGVPSFNIYNSALKDSEGKPITWKTDYTWHADESEFPFIYMWNKADNTLTAQSTSAFNFLPMHAYLVQNGGTIQWTAVSAKPSSIVARRESSAPTRYNWRITLSRDTIMEDQTYVRMTNLEQVTDTFDFGQDLVKELNTGRSDIYTYIGYERVAANSRPIANTQTVIPMGLNIESAGDYTFAIPEGTDGIGVTLIDEETGIRTSLGALSYTVNLPKGNYDNRFVLEISPIKTITTGIDEVPSNQGPRTNARKVMIDGILYIVKDGKMYDARGTLVR